MIRSSDRGLDVGVGKGEEKAAMIAVALFIFEL
jgi:hypothetical protein